MAKTLLGKIFLWSILSQAIVSAAVAMLFTLYPPYPRGIVDTAFSLYAQSAVLLYEKFGAATLNRYLTGAGSRSLLSFELDSNRGAASCVGSSLSDKLGRSSNVAIHGETATIAADGLAGKYCLTIRALPGQLPESLEARRWRTQMGVLIAPASLVVTLLACSILSYGIARYLSRPIAEVRRAVLRLAQGDLTTRVGSKYVGQFDEAADLAREFDQMAQRIADLLAAQQRLISDISHEIKAPLARLSIALGLAERTTRHYAPMQFDRMEREVEKISTLARELLTVSSLSHAGASSRMHPLDLVQLVEVTVADVVFESENRRADVIFEAPASPIVILGDENLMRRAVENVIRNAIFYTSPGVAVRVVLTRVGSGHVRLAILDEGPGVPETALAHLFEPFYRVDRARVRETGGTGVGLAICQRTVALHGGVVRALNRQPKGLAIEIDLLSMSVADPDGAVLLD